MTNVLNFINAYWADVLLGIAIILLILLYIKEFFTLPKDKQYEQIQGWLLGAVFLAEKEYGGGTGKIKLSTVYDKFVSKFPWIAEILPFDTFSNYVDKALVEMRELLASNKAVASMISEEE